MGSRCRYDAIELDSNSNKDPLGGLIVSIIGGGSRTLSSTGEGEMVN